MWNRYCFPDKELTSKSGVDFSKSRRETLTNCEYRIPVSGWGHKFRQTNGDLHSLSERRSNQKDLIRHNNGPVLKRGRLDFWWDLNHTPFGLNRSHICCLRGGNTYTKREGVTDTGRPLLRSRGLGVDVCKLQNDKLVKCRCSIWPRQIWCGLIYLLSSLKLIVGFWTRYHVPILVPMSREDSFHWINLCQDLLILVEDFIKSQMSVFPISKFVWRG